MSAAGTLRIAVVAPEYPPDLGGMHSLAYGMSAALAAVHEVTVFTFARAADAVLAKPPIERALTGRFSDDAKLLAGREGSVDVWLLLNAGLLPLVHRLERPAFVYLHGNDFLKPWIPYGSWWLEGVRKPYMAKVRHGIRRAALRRAVRGVRHVLTNSQRTSELASECLRIAPERMTVCAPGVDERFFQRHDPGHDHVVRLLTVSRLTKYSARKNVDGVLRAVAALQAELPLRYTIVGDGDDRSRLEELARRLGIENIVKFAGALRTDELLAEYRSADLFVLAARATKEDVEGFGIVYLEANAAGVPVICSRAGGAVDAVKPGQNGILLPSSSPEDIASGIREFARTGDRYRPEQVRAVAEPHRWPRVAEQVVHVIGEHIRGMQGENVHARSVPRARRAALRV